MVIELNGIQLYWEEIGEGEPLLWLHGGMGCGADWRFIFSDAPAGYRIIAPDLRGHGSSTNPSRTFTFRQGGQDVHALLAHLGLSCVKAIGMSGGGITLLHMATAAPSSIESMVVISAPPYFPDEVRRLQKQYSPALVGEAEMARMRTRHTRGDAQIQELFEMTHAFADTYDDVNFTPPYLSRITAETLIVFGDRDPLYPVSIAFELQKAIPRSYLWVVPNGGHGPVFGAHAAQFTQTALEFLGGKWRQSS